MLVKYQKELKFLKHTKNQLLAKAGDQDQKDRQSFQNWANECKKCVDNADQHETAMEVLIAKIEGADSVGKDTDMYDKLKNEVQAAYNTHEHMFEGIQLSVKRFKKFLN